MYSIVSYGLGQLASISKGDKAEDFIQTLHLLHTCNVYSSMRMLCFTIKNKNE